MKDTFGVEVGFSDHFMGHIAPVVADYFGCKNNREALYFG